MLKEQDFNTITANHGKETEETFKQHPDICLVILDFTIPHMDGEQCFRELKPQRQSHHVKRLQ
jgi:DNA-binding response OmpR family regulator